MTEPEPPGCLNNALLLTPRHRGCAVTVTLPLPEPHFDKDQAARWNTGVIHHQVQFTSKGMKIPGNGHQPFSGQETFGQSFNFFTKSPA